MSMVVVLLFPRVYLHAVFPMKCVDPESMVPPSFLEMWLTVGMIMLL